MIYRVCHECVNFCLDLQVEMLFKSYANYAALCNVTYRPP